MAINTDRFGDRIGIMKILSIVIGIFNLGFTSYSFYKFDSKDEAYLSCVIICFIISFLWALAIILDLVGQSETVKKIDMLFHMIAFVFYLITLICFTVSLIQYSTGKYKNYKHKLWQRIFSFLFGVILTAVYGYLSFLLYHTLG